MEQMFWSYWWVIPIVLSLVFYKLIFRLFGILIIPEDKMGIVNKKFGIFGSNTTLPDGQIVALNKEAGVQADTLPPGLHFWLFPWQYHVDVIPFTEIPQNQIGIVESIDGKALPAGRVLAKSVECNSFQNAREFLQNGGERGPQISIIPPGTYRINTTLFNIKAAEVFNIPDNKVGVVTTREGTPLRTGEIAGPEIDGHRMYQDGQSFLNNGGFKGLQEQVILAGKYFLNPLFVQVELKDMAIVPIASVGVIIAYIGKEGKDVTGEKFLHGNLVHKGEKGVWVEPLDPGKYPINPYTHKIELVPTANVVLNWATGKTESHNLDEKLSTIRVRSADGFGFNLDVSQIIHIPRNDAPKVIARFGSVANLVTQVLEPTIGNYFRNAAQKSDVIAFLLERKERQMEAREAIAGALVLYNVGAVDTLIGDINPPEELMLTLTDRKLAQQREITYKNQELAEVARQKLEQSKAMAETQANVVGSERKVTIATFEANAKIQQAKGEAESKVINADSDATVLEKVGNATAVKTLAIGEAEAKVIQKKTDALGQGNFALIEATKALSTSGFKLVPDIVAGGNGQGGTMVEVIMANMLTEQLKKNKEVK